MHRQFYRYPRRTLFINNHWQNAIQRHGEWGALALLTAIAAVLRVHEITFQSLWCDELITAYVSRPGVSLWHPIRHCIHADVTPPLFYFLLSLWQRIFGSGEFALRMLPMLFGVCGIPATYLLGKEMFSRRSGFFAAAILAFMPMHLFFSQAVRSYSLLYLMAALSYLFFLKIQRSQHHSLRYFCGYWACTVVLLYAHYFSFFVMLSQGVVLAWAIRPLTKDGLRRFVTQGAWLFIVPGLLYLPWVPFMYGHTRIENHWIPTPDAWFWIKYLKRLFGRHLAVPAAVLFGVYGLSRRRALQTVSDNKLDDRVILTAWLGSIVVVPFLLSLHGNSLITFRNMIAGLPPVVLMLGHGLDRMKPAGLRRVFLIIFFGLMIFALFGGNRPYYGRQRNEQWRQAVEFILEEDPEARYPVHAVDYAQFYFADVFGVDREFDFRILDLEDARRVHNLVTSDELPGFWMLDGHRLADSEVNAFLDRNLRRVAQVKLIKVNATLYKPRED